MNKNPNPSPFDEPMRIIASRNPKEVARLAGATWDEEGEGRGKILLPVLNDIFRITYPDIAISAPKELDTFTLKLLAAIYLSKTDGTSPSGIWKSFRELPGGRSYEVVLKRCVEDPLQKKFGSDLTTFEKRAKKLGGKREELGDSSFSFALFPKVKIAFVLWRGDEEFPSRFMLLFDESANRHLGTFDLRMGAEEIGKKLMAQN
ncbi:MAG: DUF3786 domain-containing protein [Actinomycetota bacterium]|nr:DUF3786 domain-containing protein [Actinomycetota bacterium]